MGWLARRRGSSGIRFLDPCVADERWDDGGWKVVSVELEGRHGILNL